MSKHDDKYIYTYDLSLATFLYCLFPISYLSRENNDKVSIAFDNTRELVEMMELYWNRSARVDPQLFFQSLKLLKSRIYEELKR